MAEPGIALLNVGARITPSARTAGSTDPAAAARAAKDLLAALEVAEARVRQAYKEVPTPTLLGRRDAARKKLQTLVADPTK